MAILSTNDVNVFILYCNTFLLENNELQYMYLLHTPYRQAGSAKLKWQRDSYFSVSTFSWIT